MYFQYGEKQINYLKSKDAVLGEFIERVGFVQREVIEDVFAAIVNSIVGQQISTKAHVTLWNRFMERFPEINAKQIIEAGADEVQKLGVSYRKADYILNLAEKVQSRELDLDELKIASDEEVIEKLTDLKGIGTWTAEMILIFSMQRPDVFSYGDLAIIRGLKRLYKLEKIDKKVFSKYRKKFSPYGSVASIYLWEVAMGNAGQK